MPGVTVIPAPSLEGLRRAPLLVEDRVGHYDEFRTFLARAFDLDRFGLSAPGYLSAPSRAVYEFVFVGRSGEPFPSGVEVNALVSALEPLDEARADRDLWAILHWLVEGTGGGWSAALLDETGRLFRIPAAEKSQNR